MAKKCFSPLGILTFLFPVTVCVCVFFFFFFLTLPGNSHSCCNHNQLNVWKYISLERTFH